MKAKSFGFWGLSTPVDFDGMDLSAVDQTLITAELGRTFIPFSFGGEADNILYECNEQQRKEYLLPATASPTSRSPNEARAPTPRAIRTNRMAGRGRMGEPGREDLHHSIQWMIADSEVELEAARWRVLYSAWTVDQGRHPQHDSAIAKLYGANMINRVADRVLQIHGGMVIIAPGPAPRLPRARRPPLTESVCRRPFVACRRFGGQ